MGSDLQPIFGSTIFRYVMVILLTTLANALGWDGVEINPLADVVIQCISGLGAVYYAVRGIIEARRPKVSADGKTVPLEALPASAQVAINNTVNHTPVRHKTLLDLVLGN